MRDKSPVLGPVVYISCGARGPVLEFATFINFSGAIKSSLEVLAIDEEVYEPDVTENTQARTAANLRHARPLRDVREAIFFFLSPGPLLVLPYIFQLAFPLAFVAAGFDHVIDDDDKGNHGRRRRQRPTCGERGRKDHRGASSAPTA